MSNQPLFADIHCHPNFKPYGQSFEHEHSDPQPDDRTSLWYELAPNGLDTRLSEELNVAMYSQSHLKAAAKGGLQIICLSLGALEKEFITISRPLPKTINDVIGLLSHGGVSIEDFFCNLVTRFGKKRLDSVQSAKTYFPDLMRELAFVRAQEGKVFQLDLDNEAGQQPQYYTFRIADSGAMVADILAQNAAPGTGRTKVKPITLCIVLTIEGLHNLDAGNGADEATVSQHTAVLKRNEFPLFFVTFSHHFWNGLCGHARSLTGLMAKTFDQDAHEGEGFHPMGLKVLMTLLDKSSGRRIPIDIKHMSYKARNQYFNLLAGTVPDDLGVSRELKAELKAFFRFNSKAAPRAANATPPVIVSHAAVNGYADHGHKIYQGNFPFQHAGVENPFENNAVYPDPSINLYDADLINLGRFRSLIGIQLDMRRITGEKGFEVARNEDNKHAYLVWNQVIHMVELWDRMGIPDAWDRICSVRTLTGLSAP